MANRWRNIGLEWARCGRIACAALLICVAAQPARAVLTFTVATGAWPNETHRTAAVNAMQQVVNRYNAFGNFGNYNVYVYYSSGIPTAQASYQGSIGFGGTYPAERVTMHELAHYLGLPSGNWNSLLSSGKWSGTLGDALVQQFDGIGSEIHGDGAHFWPYGLNFDSEGSEINKQRQVAMVYAMRADLGIGSSIHPSTATTVALTASDPAGQSGFNYKDRWSDGYFAHAGADYSTGNFMMRTPQSANGFKFAGDSLTVAGSSTNSGLHFSGQGSSGVVTIDDLVLDGGWIRHASGIGDLFQLDGHVTVASDSHLYAKQGNLNVLADLAGNGSLTIEPSDNIAENNRYVRLFSSQNTFAGDLVNESRFELADSANFNFAIGGLGENNSISGAGARATLINGTFDFDLTSASTVVGDSWNLVTAANTSYGASFQVSGFEKDGGVWTNDFYAFDPTTGVLEAILPPSAWSVDGGGLWSAAGNWSTGVPAAGDKVIFGSVLSAPATVSLDVDAEVKSATFDNGNRYRVAGSHTLTLTSQAEIISQSGGDHEIAAPIAGAAGLNKLGGGRVTLSAANPYSGDTNVHAGTLALAGAGSIGNSANVNVHPGATLDVSAAGGGLQLAGGQTLNNNSASTVVGNVTAGGGATVTGIGVFQNNLAMQAGSTLQVGAASLPAVVEVRSIDDFQSYNTFRISSIGANESGDVTGGVWDGVFDGTANARIVSDGPNKSIRVYGLAPGWRGAVTDLSENFDEDYSLAHGDTATYYMQFYRDGAGPIDSLFGLVENTSTLDITDSWRDFSVMGVVSGNDAASTTFAVHGDNGTGGTVLGSVESNTWYNVWFVVDNQSKEFDVYTSSGAGEASLAIANVQFGHVTDPANLDAFGLAEQLSGSNPNNAALRIDNLAVTAGEHLLSPLFGPAAAYAGETLTVLGDLTLLGDDSLLTMNVAENNVNDKLLVGGTATLAGILHVDVADGISLSLGDSFDLFDFGATDGAFDGLELPSLDAGLAWDTSSLYSTGRLTVEQARSGDFDGDGDVDGADVLAWLRGNSPSTLSSTDLNAWESNFGTPAGASANAATVPEPASVVMLLLGLAVIGNAWFSPRA